MKPHVENAPGLIWREKENGWTAVWRARDDIIKLGFRPKNETLWSGHEPTETEAAYIADYCRRLQDEMLAFGRGHQPQINAFDGTLKSLINCYQTDPASPFHKKRFGSRQSQTYNQARLMRDYGHEELIDINARLFLQWHKAWLGPEGKKVSMGHAFIAELRMLFSFGATLLEDRECERLSGVLHKMRFENTKARVSILTAEMATAFRKHAHARGWNYMALGQAIQFDLMLRQKDVIGEWLPLSEQGVSDTIWKGKKWLSGIRWEYIDQSLILRHTTSKRQKEIEVDLKLAPMVMAELSDLVRVPIAQLTRAHLPATGPVVLCELTAQPWLSTEYRRKWRIVAELAGIPESVKNMDSRAGAISEATDAGADLEHIRHAATHSDIGMTQRYSRAAKGKVENVMQLRLQHRNKPKTE
jgi:hypothetical protein